MTDALLAKKDSRTDKQADARPLADVLHLLPFSRAPLSRRDELAADQLLTQGHSPFKALRRLHSQHAIGNLTAVSEVPHGRRQWRVGIVLMTCQPHNFAWWLRYHLSLGVHRVFVRVEDTPSLLPVLTSDEFADFVELLPEQAPPSTVLPQEMIDPALQDGDDDGPLYASGADWFALLTLSQSSDTSYHTLMGRQQQTVLAALARAQALSIDWLFHIDDDELLHFSIPFAEIVASVPSDCTCVTLQNFEVMPSTMDPDNVFAEAQTFCAAEKLFRAYRNGKSAARVGACDWQGPHRFSGQQYVVQSAFARVLHYESATYSMWREKFERQAAHTSDSEVDTIPFSFYQESIRLVRATHNGEAASEARRRAFFREKKMEEIPKMLAGSSPAAGGKHTFALQFRLRPTVAGGAAGGNTINEKPLAPLRLRTSLLPPAHTAGSRAAATASAAGLICHSSLSEVEDSYAGGCAYRQSWHVTHEQTTALARSHEEPRLSTRERMRRQQL